LEEQVGRGPAGLCLRVVDATVINGPGATGTEWRAHVLVDPASGAFRAVELTDSSGGEGLARHEVQKGEVVLGDRAYATARGLYAVHQREAHVVVRLNPYTLRVCDGEGRKFSLLEQEEKVPKVGAIEYKLCIPIPPTRRSKSHKTWKTQNAVAWVPARAIAARTRTGEVIWLLVTLSEAELTGTRAMEIYRLRWQIELVFKRLKSLLHLDTLPSRRGPTARSWMLARFLAAALAQRLVRPSGPLFPWGYQIG
jgi:hypothetical protein